MAVRAVYDIASFLALRVAARDGDDCTLTAIACTIGRVGDAGITVDPIVASAPVPLFVDARTQITLNGEESLPQALRPVTGLHRVEIEDARGLVVLRGEFAIPGS